jgi:chromosome partitioning protein
MRKLVVALSKGGVGKTTTAVNLAAGLALAGSRVLLIEVDTQGQTAKALGLRPEAGLSEFVSGEVTSEEAILPARDGLWLLAGGRGLAGVKHHISRKEFGGEQTLSEALAPLENQYDYAILDTGPGWDALTVNALFYATEILTPVSLEIMTLSSLVEFRQSIIAIQRYHPQLVLRYVLPTFLDRRVKKSEEILRQLSEAFGQAVCAPIRYSVKLSEAPGFGQSVFEYAPRSPGAEDYRQLTERIRQDERA